MIPKIVITGAPGSGKTEFFERLKNVEALTGFAFFDELARSILTQFPELRYQRDKLHRQIYDGQIRREAKASDRPFVTDRGTLDAFAFHSELLEMVGSSIETEYARYTAVICLQSSANLGAKYYQEDKIRTESIADALTLEAATKDVWKGHDNYFFIEAQPDLEQKYLNFLATIQSYLRENNWQWTDTDPHTSGKVKRTPSPGGK